MQLEETGLSEAIRSGSPLSSTSGCCHFSQLPALWFLSLCSLPLANKKSYRLWSTALSQLLTLMILITNKIFPLAPKTHTLLPVLYYLFDGRSTTHLAGLGEKTTPPDVLPICFIPSWTLLLLFQWTALLRLLFVSKPILVRSNQAHGFVFGLCLSSSPICLKLYSCYS